MSTLLCIPAVLPTAFFSPLTCAGTGTLSHGRTTEGTQQPSVVPKTSPSPPK